MSALKDYIEKVKKETEGFSEIEIIRYVYLDLGKRFNFDLGFAFGNSESKKRLYRRGPGENNLNQNMENNLITCKSLSYIFEYVLKELGINNIRTEKEPLDSKKYPHVYNVIKTQDGKMFKFDLQQDMRNIKANLRTRWFGISYEKDGEPIISRYELERIDKKLGYVTKDLYYTDEFLELIKLDMALFEDFGEKVQFVLENLDSYTVQPIEYADRRWRMEDILGDDGEEGRLFSASESRKIHIIDCYREIEGEKEYQLCIAVDVKNNTDIYLFSDEEGRFCKVSMEEFAELTRNGLKSLSNVPRLKKFMRKQEQGLEEK